MSKVNDLSDVIIHLERIENLMKWPQAHPELRWISVSESVPPENIVVLLRGWPYTQPHYNVVVGYRKGDKYYYPMDKECPHEGPLFWMHILPLPDNWRDMCGTT